MPKALASFDVETLRLPESYLSQTKKPAPGGYHGLPKFPKAKGFKFYLLPAKVLEDIAIETRCPALIILCILNRLWFENCCHNPVTLSSQTLAKFDVSRTQKHRALKLLGKTGHITVEQNGKKNPRITLNWRPH
jgi:hypothetical protein